MINQNEAALGKLITKVVIYIVMGILALMTLYWLLQEIMKFIDAFIPKFPDIGKGLNKAFKPVGNAFNKKNVKKAFKPISKPFKKKGKKIF